ncbi:hypothetical protein MNBD_GAMMA12-1302 [hydrothermal vent metagenome]|uniref:Histidine phosphatase family protein n=1 Tax=hydrothermal vent metagenome TaxID=652676 RepID=A0A3B0XSD4_9ZZZZ
MKNSRKNYAVRGIVATMMCLVINNSFANKGILSKLAEGGKVIVMRHAATNNAATNNSSVNSSLVRDPQCQKERTLSAKGKADAKILSQYFKLKQILIASVLHSPFCRTSDTAQIVFNRGKAANYLSLLQVLTATKAKQQSKQLTKIIGSYTGKGNLILITHRPNISAIAFDQLGFLDFLVLQPKGGAEYEEIGIIRFSSIQNVQQSSP